MGTVNLLERENFMHWLIISAVTDNDIVYEVCEADGYNAEKLDVKLIINGVECPLEKTINDIEKQLDRLVEEKAKKLLTEKYIKRIEKLENYTDTLKEKMESIIETGDAW